jgi:hypothetical protein
MDDDRVVAYACGECTPRNVLIVFSEPGRIDPARIAIMPENLSLKVPYVCLVWTAAKYRRGGVARLLVEDIAQAFHVTPQELAYDTPFSPEGLRLVQQFAGWRFIASTAQLMISSVPLEHEHWLTECHRRIVMGQDEPEGVQHLREKLTAGGYMPAMLKLPNEGKG